MDEEVLFLHLPHPTPTREMCVARVPTRETLVVRVYRGCSVLRDPLHAPKPGAPYHVMSALNTLPIPHRGNDGTVCPVTPDVS